MGDAADSSALPAEPGESSTAKAKPDEGLQLDRFEPTAEHADENPGGGLCCHYCKQPLVHEFWELNGQPSCESCQVALNGHFTAPIPWSIWGRVTLWGGGAALIGTLVYFAVLKLTGYELGLIAIGVGLLVGGAVRRASGFRGGWKLQAAAMAFTYASIVSAYMPSVYEGLVKAEADHQAGGEKTAAPSSTATPAPSPTTTPPAKTAAPEQPAGGEAAGPASEKTLPAVGGGSPASAKNPPAAAAPHVDTNQPERAPQEMGLGKMLLNLLFAGFLLFLFSAAAPILAGFQNFMGWIIIGFALYEAWKMNRRPPLVLRGPLPVTVPAPSAAASASSDSGTDPATP